MSPTDSHIHALHFSMGAFVSSRQEPEPGGSRSPATGIGLLMMRGADCLAAALVACTADAGLNEARYRVLAALRDHRTGESSQSELAGLLLQSESNLSTLLERMSGDGLITRARSASDRRRSLIRMTDAGREALARADEARSAAIAHLMREFPPEQAEQLVRGLQRLVGELERSFETGARRAAGLDPAFTSGKPARAPCSSIL